MGMYDIDTSYTNSKHPEIKCTNTGDKMYQLNIVPEDLSVYTWGSKNFQKKNPYSTYEWDKAAANAGQLDKLTRTLNNALQSGQY